MVIFQFLGSVTLLGPLLYAQNSIELFGPVDVRPSQSNAGTGASAVVFNTTTLSLSCPAGAAAVLSSAPNAVPLSSTGNILADNYITVANLTTSAGPTNVCNNCWNPAFYNPANASHLKGLDPDTFVASGGVAPVDISSYLVTGTQNLEINLVDTGGSVASSTIYLNTNCTSGGVMGPAQISGNTISGTSTPPPSQSDQTFKFNPTPNQVVGFEYDLTAAVDANSLTVDRSGSNPQVADSGVSPGTSYPLLVSGTSFASSMCLVHNGELVNGQPACKLYTLTCTTGDGSSASGAQCPVSALANEVLKDTFDGPAFTLADITPAGGPTFHEGMGFLMASEGWDGGPCTFDPASNLENELCPQNLLVNFSGPGTFTGTGQTTHPNSEFISIAQVPEDLTTVIATDAQANPLALGPGHWTNDASPYLKLSSQPPSLAGTSLLATASFIAAPIASITYGISPGVTAPAPGTTTSTDSTLINPVPCPSPTSPGTPPATTFAPSVQSLATLTDGNYLIHYFAKDCAGTEELHFLQDNEGSWSTNFYTYPLNIDTVVPEIASGPTLVPTGPYTQGQAVMATFTCSDNLSGVVNCGGQTFSPGVLTTPTLTAPVPTGVAGPQTFTISATDSAGNVSSNTVNYLVNAGGDSQIHFSINPTNPVYSRSSMASITVEDINGHTPTGIVTLREGSSYLGQAKLISGSATYALSGLPAGFHTLYVTYSGDGHNAGGNSAPVQLNVQAAPVSVSVSCPSTPQSYGQNVACTVSGSSVAGTPQGSIQYTFDNGTPVSLGLSAGTVDFAILTPPAGYHVLTVSFPAQKDFAAATPQTVAFTEAPATVTVSLGASATTVTGSKLKLTAAVSSATAGNPNCIGSVTFSIGGNVLATVPVNARGVASTTVPVSSLPSGPVTIDANYGNGPNYGPGFASIVVQVNP
jgi:hypothetical protein